MPFAIGGGRRVSVERPPWDPVRLSATYRANGPDTMSIQLNAEDASHNPKKKDTDPKTGAQS